MKYKVGVWLPSYGDQPYIRDRDAWIDATSQGEAIQKWLLLRKSWIRDDEKHLVRVLEVKED